MDHCSGKRTNYCNQASVPNTLPRILYVVAILATVSVYTIIFTPLGLTYV